jgi:GDPmannose 4,6-dehydratase
MVIGAGGQDGSYLVEHLVGTGHEVVACHRSHARREGIVDYVDLRMGPTIRRALRRHQPDEIYNMAAVTSPGGAWGQPDPPGLAETTALGVLNLCRAVRQEAPGARLVHASSSAIFAPGRYGLYGVAKRFAHDVVVGFREQYGLHASNLVLYSHTSPRQDPRFLAPTVCRTVAALSLGLSHEKIILQNSGTSRDWGWAPDYVKAFPLAARLDEPADHVVASGRQFTPRQLVAAAASAVGMQREDVVKIDGGPDATSEMTPGEAGAGQLVPGWQSERFFLDGIREMVHVEIERQKNQAA